MRCEGRSDGMGRTETSSGDEGRSAEYNGGVMRWRRRTHRMARRRRAIEMVGTEQANGRLNFGRNWRTASGKCRFRFGRRLAGRSRARSLPLNSTPLNRLPRVVRCVATRTTWRRGRVATASTRRPASSVSAQASSPCVNIGRRGSSFADGDPPPASRSRPAPHAVPAPLVLLRRREEPQIRLRTLLAPQHEAQ